MNKKTITREGGIFTRLIKQLNTPYKIRRICQAQKMKEMRWMELSDTSISVAVMTSFMSEKKTKAIVSHKDILKYLTKEWEITSEEDAEDEKDKIKIYEGKSKAWGLIIINMKDIPSGLVTQCDEDAHRSWRAIIDKYIVSD